MLNLTNLAEKMLKMELKTKISFITKVITIKDSKIIVEETLVRKFVNLSKIGDQKQIIVIKKKIKEDLEMEFRQIQVQIVVVINFDQYFPIQVEVNMGAVPVVAFVGSSAVWAVVEDVRVMFIIIIIVVVVVIMIEAVSFVVFVAIV
ncbi:MAG: hypothetical protein EZS28_023353 [Streblomastix strix]|uniref:Uncharacterized protein n=1 Tax=Streblomastix strix TaxID=222440 RepID=A0A5J4VET7_9EUKA|nr:MAG: hypothetical protein EZS28_023353 [Streblomastix strix]